MDKEKNNNTAEANDLVEVFIPRDSANQDPNYFCAVNGVSYILPRGKKSMVPAHIAAEINRARAAEDAMYEAKAKLKEAAASVPLPQAQA